VEQLGSHRTDFVEILYLRLFLKSAEKTEMGRTCGMYGERRVAYRALVGKPEGRRPL
jgi:hypothetical protein